MKTDNELIAEFMGATLERATSGGRRLWSIDNLHELCKQIDIPESRVRVFYADDLEFSRSWDWLMPVVEKIESTDPYTAIHIDKSSVYLHLKNRDMEDFTIDPGNKINAVYKAVVSFIKRHNQQSNLFP
jgi:hypothetical protein